MKTDSMGNVVPETIVICNASFTRPADTTPYNANDRVSGSTSVTTLLKIEHAARAAGCSGVIMGLRISTNKVSFASSIFPQFRVHFFNAQPSIIAVDNAQWKEVFADASKRLGYYDMLNAMTAAADTGNSDMSRVVDMSPIFLFQCADGDDAIYIALETLTAFTPASEQQFKVSLHIAQN